MKTHITTSRLASIAFALTAGFFPISSHAQRTWDGGGGDGNWTTSANWAGDVAPVANDLLIFDGTTNTFTTNDFTAATAFGGIDFDSTLAGNNFSLGGNSINLTGDIISAAVASGAIDDSISLDLQLTGGDIATVLGASHNLAVSGVISDDGSARALTKEGAGALTLNGANSYTGGTTINGGRIDVSDNDALGTGDIVVSANSGASLRLLGGVTLDENITISGQAGGAKLQSIGGINTFDGVVTLGAGGTRIASSGGAEFNGGITAGSNDYSLIFQGGMILNSVVDINEQDILAQSGTTEVNVGGHDWRTLSLSFGHTARLGVDNALPVDAGVSFGWSNTTNSVATLDLNDFDQTVASIETRASVLDFGGIQTIFGGGTLTVNQPAGSKEYQGRITDGATATNLVKDGEGTLILDNRTGTANDYSGTTTINGGFIEVQDDNALGTTGFLRIDVDTTTGNSLINGSFEDFTVDVGVADAGAKVTGSNTSFDLGEVNEYTITGWAPFSEDPNDVVGRYGNSGTTTDNSFYLDTSSNVNPGAGSYDGVRGLLLNSVDGYRNGMVNEDILTDLAVDPGLLNADVEFRIAVDLIRRDLTNLGGDPTGTATFMLTDSDGTTADRTNPANAIRIDTVDIATLVGLNAKAFEFSLTGAELAAATELNLVIESTNTLAVGAESTPGQDVAYVSQVVFDNIVITARDSVSTAAANTTVNGGKLQISGPVTTAEPITIGATAPAGSITGAGGGGGTLTGPITLEDGGADFRGAGNRLTFTGGINSVANQGLSLNLPATIDANPIDLNNGPFTITSNFNNPATGSELNVAGNDWGFMRINFGGYLTLGDANVLPSDAGVEFGWSQWRFSDGTLDLNGFDQTVSSLGISFNSGGLGGNHKITDDSGSGTLTVDLPAGSKEYQGRFEGGLSLVKNGDGTQILNNKSSANAPVVLTDPSPGPVIPSDNTGPTVINAGILQIGDGACTTATLSPGSAITISTSGTLCINRPDTVTQGVDFSGDPISGSGSFEVKGGGTVVLTNNATFDDGATVSVASGSTLELNYTGTDTIDRLFLGGVQVEAGTYGMSDPSGLLTGSGELNVISGPPSAGVPNIIDIAIDGSGNVILTLDGSEAGLTAQQSDDLTDGSFVDVASTPGTNTLTIDAADADPNADGDDYFRVRN